MSGPLVSVLIPTFNAAKFVSDAVASVDAQTYARVEILVWDDGSTDDTKAVVRGAMERRAGKAPLKLGEGAHVGVSFARNRLMEKATGTIFAFLDADDVWLPQHLEKALAALAHGVEKAYVVAKAEHFVEPSGGQSWMRDEDLAIPTLPLSTLVLRAQDARAARGFDESLVIAEDLDFFQRLESFGVKRVVLDEVTARRRIHPDNTVHRLRQSRGSELLKMLHQSVKRRRRE
jgi:glycosyltransferase involved in cell wall biosynthesis